MEVKKNIILNQDEIDIITPEVYSRLMDAPDDFNPNFCTFEDKGAGWGVHYCDNPKIKELVYDYLYNLINNRWESVVKRTLPEEMDSKEKVLQLLKDDENDFLFWMLTEGLDCCFPDIVLEDIERDLCVETIQEYNFCIYRIKDKYIKSKGCPKNKIEFIEPKTKKAWYFHGGGELESDNSLKTIICDEIGEIDIQIAAWVLYEKKYYDYNIRFVGDHLCHYSIFKIKDHYIRIKDIADEWSFEKPEKGEIRYEIHLVEPDIINITHFDW